MAKKTYKELQAELTTRIVKAIEAGTPPWRKPWSCSPNAGLPRNIASKKHYRRSNILALECSSMEFEMSNCWWGTYKQWQSLGCQVKGRPANLDHWGTSIIYWSVYDKKIVDDNGVETTKRSFFHRSSAVFNLEQVEDPDGKLTEFIVDTEADLIDPTAIDDPIFDLAKRAIAATEASISHGGERAFYRTPSPKGSWPNHTKGDTITLPNPARFVSPADYYYTAFHELAHWTEVRIDQCDPKYAFNELVAEITACYLAQQLHMPQSNVMDNHERYLGSWLEAMGKDVAFIFQASKAASLACQHILEYSGLEQEEGQEEAAEAA